MSSRPQKTLIDYVTIAISPALIVALLASLLFFLLDVLYTGQFEGRLQWIMFWFALGSVCITRMALEGMGEKAAGYSLLFGLVMAVAVLQFVRLPEGSFLAPIGWLINLSLMGFIWWCAHKLTWDCTLIDDAEDASGEGLLDVVGIRDDDPADGDDEQSAAERDRRLRLDTLAARRGTPPAPAVDDDQAAVDGAKRTPIWERLLFNRGEREGRAHTPGLWVVYFLIAAIPIFGLGQLVSHAGEAGHRRYVFSLICVYVACGAGLLLTTSFLGLRRYLRQRKLEMEPAMAAAWLATGAALIVGILVVAMIIPRPRAEYMVADLSATFVSDDRRASRVAPMKSDAVEDKNTQAARSPKGKADQQGQGAGGSSRQDPTDKSKGGPASPGQSRGGSPASQPGGGSSQAGSQGKGGSSQQSSQSSSDGKRSGSSAGQQSGSQASGQASSGGAQSGGQQSGQQSDGSKGGGQQGGGQQNGGKQAGGSQSGGQQAGGQQSGGQQSGDRQGGKQGGASGDSKQAGGQGKGGSQAQGNQASSAQGGASSKSSDSSAKQEKADDSRSTAAAQQSLENRGSQTERKEQREKDETSGRGASNQTAQRPSRPAAQSSAPPPQPSQPSSSSGFMGAIQFVIGGLMTIVKWAFQLAIIAAIAYFLFRHREALARGFSQLLSDLANLWRSLFGGRPKHVDEAAAMAATGPRMRPFASFENPFATGAASRTRPEELVRHTFDALQAWAYEHGAGRNADQTPLEFAAHLAQVEPAIRDEAQLAALLYCRVHYARGAVDAAQIDALRGIWAKMNEMHTAVTT